MKSFPLWLVCSLLLSTLSLLCFIQSALAQEQCFPECREGFVCSPQGQCVSECNPVCDSGQRCMAGECYITVKEAEEQVANASASAAAVPTPNVQPVAAVESRVSPTGPKRVVVLEAGPVVQFLDYSYHDAISAYGFEVAAAFFPSSKTPYFVRPRVLIAFGENDNFYEPSVDVGYEYRWQGERLSGGLQLATEFGLWPEGGGIGDGYDPEPVGPFIGVAIAPYMQLGNVTFTGSLRHGYQLASDPNTRVTTLGFGIGVGL